MNSFEYQQQMSGSESDRYGHRSLYVLVISICLSVFIGMTVLAVA